MLVTKEQVYKVREHFKFKYGRAHHAPKSGEWFLRPSTCKAVFEVLQAQNNFKRMRYPIIDERYLNYMKKHHLTIED